MKHKTCYIVSYDIVCNKKRRRAANILEDYGIRMQKSVFECMLTPKALKELTRKLDAVIDKKEDSILIYMLCNACVKQNRFLGVKPVRLDEQKEYDIL